MTRSQHLLQSYDENRICKDIFPLNDQNFTFTATIRALEVRCYLEIGLRHAVLQLNQNERPSKRLQIEE